MQEPDLVVERSAVVRLLARLAVAAGVEIRGGCKLTHLEPGNGSLTMTIRDSHRDRVEQIQTKALIGADGMSSRVGKTVIGNGHATMPILQAIVELPPGTRQGTTKVWFEPDDTPYFFWLIPQSQRYAAVGFVAQEGKHARNRLERFLSRIGLKAVEMQSARIPAYAHLIRPWRRMAGCDVYLIGDAAAQVKVTTVGGLVTGLRGARAAANAILRRTEYLTEMRSLRTDLSLHLLIRNFLNRFEHADYDRLLDLLNPRMIHLLGIHNRDHAAKIVCRMLLAQPRFFRFAALLSRGLWKKSSRDRLVAGRQIIEPEAD